jgi:hypothetical protein
MSSRPLVARPAALNLADPIRDSDVGTYRAGATSTGSALPSRTGPWPTAAAAVQDRGRLIRVCSVLHPPTCRTPLDAAPVSTDSRAHRATRAGPDVVLNTGQGAGLSSGWRPGRGVSGRHRGERPNPEASRRTGPGFTRRTAINLSGVLNAGRRRSPSTAGPGEPDHPAGGDGPALGRCLRFEPAAPELPSSSASTARPWRE